MYRYVSLFALLSSYIPLSQCHGWVLPVKSPDDNRPKKQFPVKTHRNFFPGIKQKFSLLLAEFPGKLKKKNLLFLEIYSTPLPFPKVNTPSKSFKIFSQRLLRELNFPIEFETSTRSMRQGWFGYIFGISKSLRLCTWNFSQLI